LSVGGRQHQSLLTVAHQQSANDLAQTATKEFEFFTGNFGAPETSHLNVVEIPDDTLPAIWAPELAGIMGSRAGDKSSVPPAGQHHRAPVVGSEVSPKTLTIPGSPTGWLVTAS